MKIIAYYLPQFHQVAENERWWGKGFTEWTNVKKGKPLFKNHNQPRVPLNGYYNLLDKNTMYRQANQANEHGIYGMAFYHYWFSGDLLLEKPAENLLKWKDINMNFLFFWANHDWIRSWNGTKELLKKQIYGEKDDWKSHFMYMLPFFQDNRYIKIHNKPMMGIYQSTVIPNFDAMIAYWNNLAIEFGFDGIYIIESMINSKDNKSSKYGNAVLLRQPNIAQYDYLRIYEKIKRYPQLQKLIPFCYPAKVSYEKVMESLVQFSKGFESEKDIIFGFFSGWDNTCRHGNRGFVIINQNVIIFKKYLKELIEIGKQKNVEYIFLNAWNEWGEGMYIEPDTKDKMAYLSAIGEILQNE